MHAPSALKSPKTPTRFPEDPYFHLGDKAEAGDDRIIYDASSGKLFYDRDGNGGKYGQKLFAHVDKLTVLDASDFHLI